MNRTSKDTYRQVVLPSLGVFPSCLIWLLSNGSPHIFPHTELCPECSVAFIHTGFKAQTCVLSIQWHSYIPNLKHIPNLLITCSMVVLISGHLPASFYLNIDKSA